MADDWADHQRFSFRRRFTYCTGCLVWDKEQDNEMAQARADWPQYARLFSPVKHSKEWCVVNRNLAFCSRDCWCEWASLQSQKVCDSPAYKYFEMRANYCRF